MGRIIKGQPPTRTIGEIKRANLPVKPDETHGGDGSQKCYLPTRVLNKLDVYMRMAGKKSRGECIEALLDEEMKSLPPFLLALFRELTDLGQEIRLCREQCPEETEQSLKSAEKILDGLYDFLKREGHISSAPV